LYAARHLYECAHYHHQTRVTLGKVLGRSRVPLTKWLWTLYLVSAAKGGISALRLSQIIGVRWRTVYNKLRALGAAMADRDSRYRLTELVDVADAYVGANKTGKAGRGGGCMLLLIAMEKIAAGTPSRAFVNDIMVAPTLKRRFFRFASRIRIYGTTT
jgi:hypothetical protein